MAESPGPVSSSVNDKQHEPIISRKSQTVYVKLGKLFGGAGGLEGRGFVNRINCGGSVCRERTLQVMSPYFGR